MSIVEKILIPDFENAFKGLAKPNLEKQAYQMIINFYEQLISIFKGKQPYTLASLSTLQKNGFTIEWLLEKHEHYKERLSKLERQ